MPYPHDIIRILLTDTVYTILHTLRNLADIIEAALQAGITIRYVVLFDCVMITSKGVIKTQSTIGKTYCEECSSLN